MPELANYNICTGCTACVSSCSVGCIAMEPDESGFLYPYVDEAKCIGCGSCERACPVLHPIAPVLDQTVACAAYSKDEFVRMESSSGGVFSELARCVLSQNGAVFGESAAQ